ncbi:SDR family NAD(P)-dependent oxidoreductase [Deinococcus maricopensis]|uniref:3-oxoacyl-(Acyl-carrier-protein) reductase n=1 Tax=Deinococcus maricopensis (strain DSM 21211 / LMG 22137 / NRRL B-23946 / LB-34) TaxID=709986 RepID=E8U786_DEIML|nr:glucose 1-dehydrogenase [Deinococcus maricopensis]ADV66925.1 3-oxoacyl-(acyl-carrier-protein) reductase [Deinococcus maricopensis DSM 21211]
MPDQQQTVTPLPEPQDYRHRGRLEGRVAIVTGSESGIGQATAVEFAREGADVAVTYFKDEAGAQQTRADIEALGRRAIVVHLDQRDEASVKALFDQTVRDLGTPDILVNDAGIDATGKQVADMTAQEWDDRIRTNLYGPFYACQQFIRLRRVAGGRGKIINVTSVHEDIPRAGASGYDSSKGALRNLTRTLALELAPDLINVNNLAPGMVLTPMNQEAMDDPKVYAEQVQSIPFKRAAQPWEMARLAVYLASADADYATGQTFTLDGGLTMNQGQGA